MPSGAATASGVIVAGHRNFALYIPVLTDAVVSFASPTGAGAGLAQWRNGGGTPSTATSLGGTGNVWLGSDTLAFLRGFYGPVHVSAAAAQGADRNFVWNLKP